MKKLITFLRYLCYLALLFSANAQALTEWMPFSQIKTIFDIDFFSINGLSSDGRYVLITTPDVLVSSDTYQLRVGPINLSAFDSASLGSVEDAYLYDRQTGQYELVSVDAQGVQLQQITQALTMTPDARYVLMSGGYLRDRVNGTTQRVPWQANQRPSNGIIGATSHFYALSNDGAQLRIQSDIIRGRDVAGAVIIQRTALSVYDMASQQSSPLLEKAGQALIPQQPYALSVNGRYVFFVGGMTDPAQKLSIHRSNGGLSQARGQFYRYDRLNKTWQTLTLPSAGLKFVSFRRALWVSDDGNRVLFVLKSQTFQSGGQSRLIRYNMATAQIEAQDASDIPSFPFYTDAVPINYNISTDGWRLILNNPVPSSPFIETVLFDLQHQQKTLLSVTLAGKPLGPYPATIPSNIFRGPATIAAFSADAQAVILGGEFDPRGTLNAPPIDSNPWPLMSYFYATPEVSEAALTQTGEVVPSNPQAGDRWSPVFTVTAQTNTRETWLRLPLSEDWMLEKWPKTCQVSTRWLDCRVGNLTAGDSVSVPLTLAFYRVGTFTINARLYQSGIDRTTPDDLFWTRTFNVQAHATHRSLTQRPLLQLSNRTIINVGDYEKKVRLIDGVFLFLRDNIWTSSGVFVPVNGEAITLSYAWQDTNGRTFYQSTARELPPFTATKGLAIRGVLEITHEDGRVERAYTRFSKKIESFILLGTATGAGGSANTGGVSAGGLSGQTLTAGNNTTEVPTSFGGVTGGNASAKTSTSNLGAGFSLSLLSLLFGFLIMGFGRLARFSQKIGH